MNRKSTLRPAVHGHRGARGRLPENTLPAISFAAACGADAVEVDVCVTADDALVLHHDLELSATLSRDQSGTRPVNPIAIRELDLETVRQCDVGRMDRDSEYAKRFDRQVAMDGTRIPTLTEFIERVIEIGGAKLVLNIELKSNPDRPELTPDTDHYITLLLATLDTYDLESRLFIQSFDWRLIERLKTERPGILAGLLTDMQADGAPPMPVAGKATAWTAGRDLADFDSVAHMVKDAGARVWSSQYKDLSHQLVEQAHQLDLLVYCWTVNEDEDMDRMIDMGVDAITTDFPERLVRKLAGNASPPANRRLED